MPIMFNSVLRDAGFDPAKVALIRHQDTRAAKGVSPYQLWREKRLCLKTTTRTKRRITARSSVARKNGQRSLAPRWQDAICRHV